VLKASKEDAMPKSDQTPETGPWDAALAQVREWDPEWADACEKMATNPWSSPVLPRKTAELISLAINVACTNLNPDGTRRHIRAALQAGATRDEILMVLKMASVMSIHSCSLGAPILLEEAKAAGVKPTARSKAATPACDKMRAVGQWNEAWDPFFELDPNSFLGVRRQGFDEKRLLRPDKSTPATYRAQSAVTDLFLKFRECWRREL
jgi:alkylhydroperoxidase/carboxymuconolactone decarboxylase family protein YurZ